MSGARGTQIIDMPTTWALDLQGYKPAFGQQPPAMAATYFKIFHFCEPKKSARLHPLRAGQMALALLTGAISGLGDQIGC
jgi:hypothetical protein